MKLTKVDIAEALGMTYTGEEYIEGVYFYVFQFGTKQIKVRTYCDLDEAWEEAAEKLLDPLVDYLLGNLDDE
jgi:outer membrane protein assembly factor BamE (lipoprotein component of BamABCDE complex)